MAIVLSGTTNDILINGVSVATDAEVSSAVASGVAPKVDLANFIGTNQVLSVNGYQKLPGGLIIQWGNGVLAANNIQQAITFPISFPNSCFLVNVTPYTEAQTTADSFFTYSGLTKTGFTCTNSTTSGSFAPSWVAIGY